MDLVKIKDQVVEATRKVSKFMRKEFESFDSSKVEKKGVNDLVSFVDKESERMLVSELVDILPDAGFITEEGTVETDMSKKA